MPTVSEALAIALENLQAGRPAAAEEICRRILEVAPEEARAWELLGAVARQQAHYESAVEHFRRAIEADDRRASAHFNLGSTWLALRRLAEAAGSFHKALQLDPRMADAWLCLASIHKAQGELDRAIECLRRAIQLQPDEARAHNELGNALADRGRPDEAIACYRRALQLRPDYAGVYNNLGNVWKELGRPNEAIECYRQALRLKPDFAGVHCNLGSAWRQLGKLDEAIAAYQEALRRKPDYAVAHNNLAGVWKDQGEIDRSLACYRRALELEPDYAEALSNYLCALRYDPGTGPAELAAAHAEYQRRHAAPLENKGTVPICRNGPEGASHKRGQSPFFPHALERDPDRPLRLGFVSPSFAAGPVGSFAIGAVENLDRRGCEVVCYSDRIMADPVTARFKAAATAWHEVFGLSDEQLAEQIRADKIDVLLDLAGHGPRNRLLVFARRPAPVQITWLDSVGTTGLPAIDYVLADPWQIPAESEGYYTERVLRMPEGYVSFDPPREAPPVGSLPALARGQVTFASFNNPAKVPAAVVEHWARILRRVPGSRLLMKYRGLDDPGAGRRYRERFAACGVDPERVELRGGSSRGELLGTYNEVDVALDPFSYNGGLTTCEALWMGVPVITCPGETFARRHSLGHLSALGWTETVAGSPDQYVELAARLAGNLARLAEIRASLRDCMARSPLCDHRRFAENLLRLLGGAWRRWAESR